MAELGGPAPGPDTVVRASIIIAAPIDGTTLVELEHSGLDRHGPSWQRLRNKVSGGWTTILQRFAVRVDQARAH